MGRYWVPFPTLRNSRVDTLHRYTWLKDLVAKLPDRLKPAPQEYGLVIAFDQNGEVITSLQDTRGTQLREITSVNPHRDYLYFGSLHNDRIGRLAFQAIPGFGDNQ